MNSETPHPLLSSATLGLWLSCLVVGLLGLALHYPREHVPAREPPAVVGETMHVDLPNEPSPADAPPVPDVAKAPPIPAIPQPPWPQEPVTPPEAPQLAAVMTPNPPAAFSVPVQAPSRAEEPKKAAAVAPPAPATAAPARATAPNPVRHLVFGVGEGQQPDPLYPREAIIAREQGTVGVRFTVGGDGKVLSADVASPCRWPRLNQAAVRAVRDHWRFVPGPVRFFDVSIQFQLNE